MGWSKNMMHLNENITIVKDMLQCYQSKDSVLRFKCTSWFLPLAFFSSQVLGFELRTLWLPGRNCTMLLSHTLGFLPLSERAQEVVLGVSLQGGTETGNPAATCHAMERQAEEHNGCLPPPHSRHSLMGPLAFPLIQMTTKANIWNQLRTSRQQLQCRERQSH